MRPIPLLFVSDAPDLPTGLARITRDLATLVSRLPQYRVGVMGRGGMGSRQLPFVQYPFDEVRQWGENNLPNVWADFSPREYGIVFTIWDASRLLWFGRSNYLPEGPLQRFLNEHHFAKWGYFPIDATGPADRLSVMSAETLMGYDKVLTYTKWAEGLVRRSLGDGEADQRGLDWLPHGLNLKVFAPTDKKAARAAMFRQVHDNDCLVGVVATNQARKDWGLVAQVCRLLTDKWGHRIRFWWHVDVLERHWSIPALLTDFGLGSQTIVTQDLTDAQLATSYSACDVTLHPGLGEGFGYPIAESLACGTPAIHGDYAGGAALIPKPEWKVRPAGMRLDTLHNVYRPVFDPVDWLTATEVAVEEPDADLCRASVECYDWAKLWPGVWEKRFVRWAEEWQRWHQ